MATIGLTRLLPKPKNALTVARDETAAGTTSTTAGIASALGATQLSGPRVIPPYLQRQNFVPRVPQDFGDGGAFPEIHAAQFPLNMGKKETSSTSSTALVTVDVSADGKVQYDAIVRQGTNRNKTVYSKLGDVKDKEADELALVKPTPEEEMAVALATKNKLEALIGGKVQASRPTQVGAGKKEVEPAYVKYTPNPSAPGYNPAASQRVVELVEAQVDPLEPPKHKHKKVPRGAPEDPVPVLHSPPRKLSVQDQEMWKIPPCVSNWKNPRGYTIPLDKRLAADGRGLQDAQALYIAEQQAREELHLKQKLNQKLAKKEREQKEQELRDMAARSRIQRSGIQDMEERLAATNTAYEPPPSSGSRTSPPPAPRGGGGRGDDGMTEEERVAMEQRERLRAERRRELEMDMRKQNMKGALRKSKMDRDGERDVSEKIALGMHVGSTKLTGEEMYDARLFNQGGGVGGGFGGEDDYNIYNKSLFDKGVGSSIYRPRGDTGPSEADADAEFQKLRSTDKFRPDKGFAGADYGGPQSREAPVQFEKEGGGGRSREGEGSRQRDREREKEEDFFELDQFISDAKKGKKNPLGHIGSKGGMVGGTGSREDLEGGGSKRQRIDFSESTRR